MTTTATHASPPIRVGRAMHRWTAGVLGVVSERSVRRRPGDVVRIAIAIVVVGLLAIVARNPGPLDVDLAQLVGHIPSGLEWVFEVFWLLGSAVVIVIVVLIALAFRRFRLAATMVAAGLAGWLMAALLAEWVDAPTARASAVKGLSITPPDYPAVQLAVAASVVLAAAPFLTRPARRATKVLLGLAAIGAWCLSDGWWTDIAGALVLGWGVAALAHLALGSPNGTPSVADLRDALDDLGIGLRDATLAPEQSWGSTRFHGTTEAGATIRVDVFGRDEAEAGVVAKVWRALWFKESGATLNLTRRQQVEHVAFLLLLANRADVRVVDVLAAGAGGPRNDAALVTLVPEGAAITTTAATAVTDAVLDDAWANLERLHAAQLALGQARFDEVVLSPAGTTTFTDFSGATSGASTERQMVDRAEFLASSAVVVGNERALAASHRALGEDFNAMLTYLEPAALRPSVRHAIPDAKHLLPALRTDGAALVDVTDIATVELRRVTPAQLAIVTLTFFGVYLLLSQLSGIDDLWSTIQSAEWAWVAVAFVLAQLPNLTGAVALQGATQPKLPLGPTTAVQVANNFAGLIAGTVGNVALVVRYYQKQGMTAAVALSSGILSSVAAFMVELVLILVCIPLAKDNFDLSFGGESGSGSSKLIFVILAGSGIVIGLVLIVPRFRRSVMAKLKPQLHDVRVNLAGVAARPTRMFELFGGNIGSQVLFAMTLGAALHAFGVSLDLPTLILINSFASFLAGLAPVPGGMGVMEAGFVAGLTAAGVPSTQAVAATLVARMCTFYLPPIWGYISLVWLRRHDYV